MRAANRLPDFSVVVWIRVSERFHALRSELLSLAAEEPYEMTQIEAHRNSTYSAPDVRKIGRALNVKHSGQDRTSNRVSYSSP